MALFKKGDRMDLDNYKGIILMGVVGKVFSGILRDILEKFYEDKIVEEQAGFRKGRGYVDQGYTLAQVVLKRLEVQKNTYLCFVDLRKHMIACGERVCLEGWWMMDSQESC